MNRAIELRDAATLMLLRPCPDPETEDIEVLMVLRNRRSGFVPGYYVFPGGVVESRDYAPEMERFMRGANRREAFRLLADSVPPEKALGAWVAAIRETFEEVGILIADRKDGTPVTIETEEERRRFGHDRKLLMEGKMKFDRMLAAEELFLPFDRLCYFSHWVTPEFLPRRYDVRFFITQAPGRQTVAHDGVELTGHRWIRPSAALHFYEQGQMDMVLPQIMTLQDLARFKTIADVMDSARKRNVSATATQMKRVNGRDVEVMPDGTVYQTRPPVYSWYDPQDEP